MELERETRVRNYNDNIEKIEWTSKKNRLRKEKKKKRKKVEWESEKKKLFKVNCKFLRETR